jgi:hypothetical protein
MSTSCAGVNVNKSGSKCFKIWTKKYFWGENEQRGSALWGGEFDPSKM